MSDSSQPVFDLLEKSELKVVGIHLQNVDLNTLAGVVAQVLDLEPVEVLVTDYLNDAVTFDILRRTVYPHQLLNRSDVLIDQIGRVAGVLLDTDAAVESRGMLGWIAADEEDLARALDNAQRATDDLMSRIAKRVLILSTGAELVNGEVKDTNAVTIASVLGDEGYRCDHGGAVRDDADLIAGTIRTAIDNGYGLVITTGGVGAEAKDCTIEAVLKIDPDAFTPFLCRFEIDHDRHHKNGIRVGVGRWRDALIVSLPGPNDEVRRGIAVLRDGLREGAAPADLASAIATDLRAILRERMDHQGTAVWHQDP